MKRNSTTGELMYHNLEFYDHAPLHVNEVLVKSPKALLSPSLLTLYFMHKADFEAFIALMVNLHIIFKA